MKNAKSAKKVNVKDVLKAIHVKSKVRAGDPCKFCGLGSPVKNTTG